jgi:putative tryptophan/tyrosine transport system substrate-binding protein
MKRREFIIVLSGAVLWPVVPSAQQPTMPAIGFLSSRSPDESKHLLAAFHKGLSEVGFVEGANIVVEYRWALGDYEKLPALATDLVQRRVAVIAAVGGDVSSRAAVQATSTIPIVFSSGSDPVKAQLVRSLSKPEGNATGFTPIDERLGTEAIRLIA